MNMSIVIASVLLLSLIGLITWKMQVNQNNSKVINNDITITALCNGQNICKFIGQDITLNVQITNTSGQPISIPLQFLQQRGPSIRLINQQTNQDLVLPTNPANQDLLNDYTTLQPQESAKLDWVITTSEISQLGIEQAGIKAEISISTPYQSGSNQKEAMTTTIFQITQ